MNSIGIKRAKIIAWQLLWIGPAHSVTALRKHYNERPALCQVFAFTSKGSGEILNNLAMTYLKTGRSAQALVYAESAKKTATESFLPDVLLTLGQIHAAMGRFSIATRCIQEALRKADEMPGIYKSTAILYEELRLYEKAYHYASLYLQKVGATERQEAVRLRDRISEMLPESRQRAWSD